MAHEQELTRLQDYYEEHKDLLDRVDRWKKLWSQFLEFEVCILMAVCSLLAAGKPGNVMEPVSYTHLTLPTILRV